MVGRKSIVILERRRKILGEGEFAWWRKLLKL